MGPLAQILLEQLLELLFLQNFEPVNGFNVLNTDAFHVLRSSSEDITIVLFKDQNISKAIIHDNDATHENESKSVHKIDPEVKFWSILRTIWSYSLDG